MVVLIAEDGGDVGVVQVDMEGGVWALGKKYSIGACPIQIVEIHHLLQLKLATMVLAAEESRVGEVDAAVADEVAEGGEWLLRCRRKCDER